MVDPASDDDTWDLLSTPGALEQIRHAEADISSGHGIDADQLRREFAARLEREATLPESAARLSAEGDHLA
jgi:hypothetical protein